MSTKTSRHPTRSAIRKRDRKSSSSSKTQPDPVILLHVIARMLTECEKAGIHPRLKNGIVYTDAGYVLVIKDGKWAARPLKKKS
jgi:hypothetical protein